MNFKRYLKEAAEELEREIGEILGDWVREVKQTSPKLVPLAQAFVKACEGGKRIRGTLVKLGYEIAKQSSAVSLQSSDRKQKESLIADSEAILKADDSIIKIGAAYEIFHTAILAHDDIIDKSDLRRGLPTLYKALGGDHYGISQTIALGDIGFFLTVKIMADADFPPQYKTKALAFFAQTVVDTGLGEALDVEVPHIRGKGKGESGKWKEEDVIAIHRLKTAQYTISGPLILGAILAGASIHLGGDAELSPGSHLRGELSNLAEFGESLGIAFQIQDDILGVFGDEKELGKSTTSDIEEGKNTLLITEALKRANSAQRQILDRYYGQGVVGVQGLKAVRQVFKETGSLDYSQQFGVKYVSQAKKLIPQISGDEKMNKLLTGMADFLVQRSK